MRSWTLLHSALALVLAGCTASPGKSAVRTDDAARASRTPHSATWQVHNVEDIVASPATARLSPEELHRLAVAAKRASASVVHIRTVVRPPVEDTPETRSPTEASAGFGGSGFMFGRSGLILTTEHVLRDAASITVVLPDGFELEARRVAEDERFDLAMIAIDAVDLPPALASSTSAPVGAAVTALAGPNPRLTNLARNGRVLHTALSLQADLGPVGGHDYRKLIESTVPLESGFSGGPMIDGDGRVVGLVVAAAGSADSPRARGYALPMDEEVSATIDRLMAEADRTP
jgi:S1-C subfamily serine protease